MANPHRVPASHLIGLVALAAFSTLVVDYAFYRLSLRAPRTFALPISDVMDEITNIASERWEIKGGK